MSKIGDVQSVLPGWIDLVTAQRDRAIDNANPFTSSPAVAQHFHEEAAKYSGLLAFLKCHLSEKSK